MSRKGFEAWAIRRISPVSFERDEDNKEVYFDDFVQLAWEAWQKGYELGVKRGAFKAIFAQKRGKGHYGKS